eukprot:944248-Rhodomonas_salina.1
MPSPNAAQGAPGVAGRDSEQCESEGGETGDGGVRRKRRRRIADEECDAEGEATVHWQVLLAAQALPHGPASARADLPVHVQACQCTCRPASARADGAARMQDSQSDRQLGPLDLSQPEQARQSAVTGLWCWRVRRRE